MKFDTVDDGRERLDDLAQTEEAITARMENESRYTTTPTPAPTEDARWLSPEQRENIPHMRTDNARDIEIDVRLLLKHAAYMDEHLKQVEVAHREETRSYEAYIAKLNHQIAAKDREIAELRKDREQTDE